MAEQLALGGIRVLDLATLLAAPTIATLLSDFGAEVVKVEQPVVGDPLRASAGPGERSPFWVQEGRNRKSVAVDLRTAAGQELIRSWVPQFDIIITNYRSETLLKWGLDADTLLALQPNAVIAVVSGFGLSGPNSSQGGFDRVASAFSGLTYASGEPNRAPVRSGFAVVDYLTGYLGAFAVLTALRHREVGSGAGQIIDLPLYEAAFRATEDAFMEFTVKGRVRERRGNRTDQMVPAGDFETRDGLCLTLHAGTPSLFVRLMTEVLEQPELVEDERFRDHKARVRNQDELYVYIEKWVAQHDRSTAIELLTHNKIPVSPLMSMADIASDSHYQARRSITRLVDPEIGQIAFPSPVPNMSVTPPRVTSLGPKLGAHTDEVLAGDLDLSVETLESLRQSGVIA